jgi:hypothetical protein
MMPPRIERIPIQVPLMLSPESGVGVGGTGMNGFLPSGRISFPM